MDYLSTEYIVIVSCYAGRLHGSRNYYMVIFSYCHMNAKIRAHDILVSYRQNPDTQKAGQALTLVSPTIPRRTRSRRKPDA